MSKIIQRYIIVAILFAMTATLVNALQYNSVADETNGNFYSKRIPMQIGKWNGRDLILEENVYKILETRNIIHRNYVDNNGNVVLLSIVHYQDTKVDFHAPEACLGGLGQRTTKAIYRIKIKHSPISIEIAEVKSFSPSGNSLSFYFYKSGKYLGQNYIKMRLNIAKNKLFHNDTSGSLIRISSSQLNSNDDYFTREILKDFLENLLRYYELL